MEVCLVLPIVAPVVAAVLVKAELSIAGGNRLFGTFWPCGRWIGPRTFGSSGRDTPRRTWDCAAIEGEGSFLSESSRDVSDTACDT